MKTIISSSILEILSTEYMLKYNGISRPRAIAMVKEQARSICKKQVAGGKPSNAHFTVTLGVGNKLITTAYAN
jgi:hypothetical protein